MCKRKNENTLDKEIQDVEDTNTQLKQIKQLEENNLKNFALHDQDSNDKSNNDSINEQNKDALEDKATLSQIANQPYNDTSQQLTLKIDHSKAVKIYQKVSDDFPFERASKCILGAPGHYKLEELMRSYAVQYRNEDKEDIVILLEDLYNGLLQHESFIRDNAAKINPNDLTIDQLFEKAIAETKDVATYYHKASLINYLDEIYCATLVGEVSNSE